MRRLALVGVVVVLVGAVVAIPPAPLVSERQAGTPPDSSPPSRTVYGAFHVHSARSDGSGTIDSIAQAAAAANLSFVVVTDHGDATGQPASPSYRSGVLCLQGTEISTNGGHYVALALDPSPYPLGGEAEDVVEDVARLGGFGVVAHPDSPKPTLAWQAWDAPFEALEWFNLDSQWRDERYLVLLRGALGALIRPASALAAIADRPDRLLDRWDRLGRSRRVVGVTAVDAHARIGLGERGDSVPVDLLNLPFPSYAASFSAVKLGVQLAHPLSGRARDDADLLLRSLRAGRSFGVISGLALPGSVRFEGQQDGRVVLMGDEVSVGDGEVRLRADIDVPTGARTLMLRDGVVVQQGSDTLQRTIREPGVYRIEVRLAQAPGDPPMPWLVTNPVYVRDSRPMPAVPDPEPHDGVVVRRALGEPLIEQDGHSRVTVDSDGEGGFELHYSLARRQGPPAPWVALAWTLPENARDFTGLAVSMASDLPMRASWQLRSPGHGDLRWRKSLFLSSDPRTIDLPFDRFRRVRAEQEVVAPLEPSSALLFVIDTVNTLPGTTGSVHLSIEGFLADR